MFCRLASGGSVSSVKVTGALAAPRLPAWSVSTALRILPPSGPRSLAATLKSTLPPVMCASVSVTTFGVPNAAPPISNSSVSPATANDPVVGSVTRKLVSAASAAFMRPSARSSLPVSATLGAAGAVVSSVKFRGADTAPGLPAASVMTALRLVSPSRPRSVAPTVKSTPPARTSAVLSVRSLRAAKG